jgi:hypothetical protein
MATMNVLDAAGGTVAVEKPLAPGRAAATASRPIVMSTEDKAAIDLINTKLDTANGYAASTAPVPVALPGSWEAIAASATQVMGGTGAIGDYLSHVTIIPATTSPGAVQIKDGGGSAITIFAGGASSVTNLVPFAVPLGLTSLAGAWTIITNANESAIAAGKFSA